MIASLLLVLLLCTGSAHCKGSPELGLDYVRTVHEDDPLVQELLAGEGPGWRLVQEDTSCQHSHQPDTCRAADEWFHR